MEVSHVVDAALREHVVVFGSLPPDGRDLDILVRGVRPVTEALAAAGFDTKPSKAAWFAGGDAYLVDIVDSETWRLQDDEAGHVFALALPIEGFDKLMRPAPHHVLLISARRFARTGVLDAKRRERVQAALREDPAAWELAAARASAWHARRALDLLQDALSARSPGSPSKAARVAAVTEEISGLTSPSRARALALKTVARPTRRGHAISFSGLDGSGKTTQAEALRHALGSLGITAVYSWTKIARDPVLNRLARLAKGILRAGRGRDPRAERPGEPRETQTEGVPPAIERGHELSRRNAAVNLAWTTIVAIANGRTQRRAVVRHVRAGRVVICDRYVLDTAAHLRYRYGLERRYAFQIFINRLMSPRPLRAYLLAVPPEEALRRKHEQYDLAQLTVLGRLYREEAQRLGVEILDGTAPTEELQAAIARDVWRAIG